MLHLVMAHHGIGLLVMRSTSLFQPNYYWMVMGSLR